MKIKSTYLTKSLLVSLLSAVFSTAVSAQVLLEPKIPRAIPHCAVKSQDRASFPGENTSLKSSQTYALRTANGGLKAVKVDDIIGCNVSLTEVGGRLMVLVKARNVNSEPITLDKEGVLVVAPVEKAAVWEKSVDMTKQDRFEFDAAETKLGFSVIVGIQRID